MGTSQRVVETQECVIILPDNLVFDKRTQGNKPVTKSQIVSQKRSKKSDGVAVVVGRFQGKKLTKGHRKVLNCAMRERRKMLIVVGVRKGLPAWDNELPYKMVEAMLRKAYPDAVILPLHDHPIDNTYWSKELDKLISNAFPKERITLFAGRDGFFPHYTGRYIDKVEVPELKNVSATDQRDHIVQYPENNASFRAGYICAVRSRLPVVYGTVDIAIYQKKVRRVLLISRNNEMGKLRFPGGFIDPTDKTVAEAAMRELKEEVQNIRTTRLKEVGTCLIDDYRYRRSRDRIMTHFYAAVYKNGEAKHGDDADGVHWVSYDDLIDVLSDEHKPLGKMFLKKYDRKKH